MSFSDGFRNRMSKQGINESDSILNATFELANREFTNSPTFKVVKVNGADVDARLLDGSTGIIKYLLLRPKSTLNIGDYVEIDSRYWMVFDFNGEGISPKATIQACNEMMSWEDANGVIHKYPTLATATRNTKFDIASDRMQVQMLQAGIYAYLPYNEVTKDVRTSQRFIFGDRVYEISGTDDLTMIDENRVGIIQFSCKITTKTDKDDFVNRIADNTTIYLSEQGIKVEEEREDNVLW
jgi:DNA gyrase inhibitor GyrI